MKSGSRPIARIARTGEFTPPGITPRARSKSAAERVSLRVAVTVPRTILDALAQLPSCKQEQPARATTPVGLRRADASAGLTAKREVEMTVQRGFSRTAAVLAV